MFTHPLARAAKVWTTGEEGGQGTGRILVVITTLDLDPSSKRYSAEKVRRLSDSAREWLAANDGKADTFVLINRAKDW